MFNVYCLNQNNYCFMKLEVTYFFLMAPAHFYDVTDDKMKSNLVTNSLLQKNTWVPLESCSLCLKNPIKVVEHILATRESSCGLDMFKTFTTTCNCLGVHHEIQEQTRSNTDKSRLKHVTRSLSCYPMLPTIYDD